MRLVDETVGQAIFVFEDPDDSFGENVVIAVSDSTHVGLEVQQDDGGWMPVRYQGYN